MKVSSPALGDFCAAKAEIFNIELDREKKMPSQYQAKQQGGPLEVASVSKHVPAADEVLVRIEAVGLNPIDSKQLCVYSPHLPNYIQPFPLALIELMMASGGAEKLSWPLHLFLARHLGQRRCRRGGGGWCRRGRAEEWG